MSTTDIKYYNLLVHYGVNFKSNLNELLNEGLIDIFSKEKDLTLLSSKVMKMMQIRHFKIGSQMFLTGLLYKEGELIWESVPDDDLNPVNDPGSKQIMPYSRFILSISDHRLFWITKRGLTKSPSSHDFCYFIKRITLPILREKYSLDAEIEWESAKEELMEAGFKNKRNYISTYLREHNLLPTLMEVRVVPEVAHEKITEIIDNENYIVKSAVFYPHMNNVTDDDCEELFTAADKIAKEAGSDASVTLKPKSNDEGIKKNALKDILNINSTKNLLRFKMSLKNIRDKRQKPLTVSNISDDESGTSIAKTAVIEGEPLQSSILSTVMSELPDMIGDQPANESIVAKVETGIKKLNV